ncbi:MAG: hypothetical protein CSA45_06035 [Gammaproteobacteria bacterium]|nr:MAG: hypothetical protein CSA45_06035 [Gammaproteobacteria bacterium]
MQYNFEWDPNKAHINAQKHGVTFEEATQVFDDPMALTVFDDEESSEGEDRWVTLGQIEGRHYLVVVHTYRNASEDTVTIRLISARPATKHEIRQYEG